LQYNISIKRKVVQLVVNISHFGKRISVLRRKAGLSQTDLAEKLGVTSQAVSKWECGNAVPDIDMLLELSHMYKVTINEMLEDVDLLYELTGKETGHSGIAYFVAEQERDYNVEWANEIRAGQWIKRNWEYSRADNANMDGVGKQIASCDGTILEIGAGPGGGYMPYILKANPYTTIIINDLSPTVVSEWNAFWTKHWILPIFITQFSIFAICLSRITALILFPTVAVSVIVKA